MCVWLTSLSSFVVLMLLFLRFNNTLILCCLVVIQHKLVSSSDILGEGKTGVSFSFSSVVRNDMGYYTNTIFDNIFDASTVINYVGRFNDSCPVL